MGDWAMLIEFTLRNWRCFAEEAALSMLPSRERRYAWTMPRFATAPKRLLPVAFIHGANGSGKSAVLEGLRCLTHLVLHGFEEMGASRWPPVCSTRKNAGSLYTFPSCSVPASTSASMSWR